MDVSVIIVNYNAKDVLRDCLRSVYDETTGIEFEVIIVDNASADCTVEMVRGEFPQTKLLANTENRGFAGGNNDGIRVAKGRYVLLLNPDTVILRGAIQKVVAFADTREEAGVVGCRAWDGDGSRQYTCHAFPTVLDVFLKVTGLSAAFPRNRFFARGLMTWWEHNDTREVDAVAGCFMLVRREALEEVGGLDERYFMYVEEIDWCYRFRKAGWHVHFYHEAEIVHLMGASSKAAARDMNLERRKSLLAFFKKNRGVCAAWAANGLFAIADAVRVLGWWIADAVGKFAGKTNAARRARISSRRKTLAWHVLGVDGEDTCRRKVRVRALLWRILQVVTGLCYVGLVAAPRRLVAAAVGRPRRELIVLGYHGVKDFQRAGFAWQMDRLLDAGSSYAFEGESCMACSAPLDQHGRSGAGKPGRPGTVHSFDGFRRRIAVTFDDAFRNIMRNALPELALRGIGCVIFVPAGSIGGLPGWTMREGSTDTAEPVMSIEDLKAVRGPLVTIEAHGVRHIRIGRLGEEEATKEMVESKRMLEDGLGTTVDLIAFPHGDWVKRTVELAKMAGYRRAFSIEPKIEIVDSGKFLVGRFLADPEDWAIEFWLKLRGGYEWTVPLRWAAKRIRRKLGHVPKTGMPQMETGASGK